MNASMNAGTGPAHNPKRDRVAECLAPKLGVKAETARQMLMSPRRWVVAHMIESFAEVHEFERGQRFAMPIVAALSRLSAEPFSADLMRRAQVADANEEIAQSNYQSDPCPMNRDRYIDALAEQYTTTLALYMAMVNDRKEQAA